MQKKRYARILLVEDNPDDVELTLAAFEDSTLPIIIDVAIDGKQALEYLHKEGEFAEVERPDLILLDLNLPKVDGRNVLAVLKKEQDISSIPIIVLTTSQSEKDISQSYMLHANCYISKPVDYHRFIDVVQTIDTFWLNTVRLPDGKDYSK